MIKLGNNGYGNRKMVILLDKFKYLVFEFFNIWI